MIPIYSIIHGSVGEPFPDAILLSFIYFYHSKQLKSKLKTISRTYSFYYSLYFAKSILATEVTSDLPSKFL